MSGRDADPEMYHFVLLGPPASGKGTQAALLSNRSGYANLSTGRLLREEIQNGTALGKVVRGFMDRGELVPDETINRLVHKTVRDLSYVYPALVFDGYPRSMAQAQTLDEILRELHGNEVDLVLNLDVEDDEVIRRLSGRRECENCGATYNLVTKPPKDPSRCDVCSSTRLMQRPDDHPTAIARRLAVYRDRTRPLIDHYDGNGVLESLDGSGSIEDVHSEIVQHINAAIRRIRTSKQK